MDENTFHGIIMKELTRIREKLDDQHRRIDQIAQELIRMDTERKTEDKIEDSLQSQSQWGWEKALGIMGIIGITAGLIIALL
jgi:hypothetical protein